MCEARSRQFEDWQGKTKMFNERSEPIMLITYWYLCFPVSRVLWFCHMLLLFGKSLLDIISFDFFHTCTLPLLSFSVLSAFMVIPSTISHLWNQPCHARQCSWQYVDAVLTSLHPFIKRDRSAHIYIYIYIYIHTNPSSESDCRHQD